MTSHLFAALVERIENFDAPFLETANGNITTYSDFLGRSAKLAHALVAAGAKAGDRILVQVEKSPVALALYLACVRAGVIFVPLNTAYTVQELDYLIADADPAIIVCRPADRDAMQRLGARRSCLTLDEKGNGSLAALAARQEAAFPDAHRQADDI